MNRLHTLVSKMNGYGLPNMLHQFVLSTMFKTKVKFAGTTGIHIRSLTGKEAHVTLKNSWRIQNHIGGIHACAVSVLAESTSGMLLGLHVPDTHLPLLKKMSISYKTRIQGNLTAIATLTNDQVNIRYN